MSISANLHGVSRAEAWELPNASSLRLINGDNCSFTVFMPYATAVAMVEAFNARQPKPATDEAAS